MGITDISNVHLLRSYLNFKARIEISDGRIFIGTFVCIDKQKNIILAQAEEHRQGKLALPI
jgi:small nuclear ribonucleoprotein (snRNP)-like protein